MAWIVRHYCAKWALNHHLFFSVCQSCPILAFDLFFLLLFWPATGLTNVAIVAYNKYISGGHKKMSGPFQNNTLILCWISWWNNSIRVHPNLVSRKLLTRQRAGRTEAVWWRASICAGNVMLNCGAASLGKKSWRRNIILRNLSTSGAALQKPL